jgi:hypothetical protein
MRRLMFLALLGACASAGRESPATDGQPGAEPGIGGPLIDAMPDAPPDMLIMQTLSQTTSNQNAASNSIACQAGTNSWYRVFPLADFGITGPFNVQSVTFGVQEAGGSPPINVKIGTYAGTPGTTLDLAMITALNQVTINAANQTNPGANVTTNITGTVPAGGKLVVEINRPNAGTSTVYFYIGASNQGETKSGYMRGPSCNPATPNPTTPATLGFPATNLNIVVTGTH